MEALNLQAEITALEIQLHHYENLLEQSIRNDVEFAKTKEIFNELKKVTDRLKEIKRLASGS